MKLIFEVGKFYKTRDGRKVEFLIDYAGKLQSQCPLLFATQEGYAIHTRSTGALREAGEHPNDVISEWKEPVKVNGWVNVYKYNDGDIGRLHKSKTEAREAIWIRGNPVVATIFVSGTEGEEPKNE